MRQTSHGHNIQVTPWGVRIPVGSCFFFRQVAQCIDWASSANREGLCTSAGSERHPERDVITEPPRGKAVVIRRKSSPFAINRLSYSLQHVSLVLLIELELGLVVATVVDLNSSRKITPKAPCVNNWYLEHTVFVINRFRVVKIVWIAYLLFHRTHLKRIRSIFICESVSLKRTTFSSVTVFQALI